MTDSHSEYVEGFEVSDLLDIAAGLIALLLVGAGVYKSGVVDSWSSAQPNFTHGFYFILVGVGVLVIRMITNMLARR